MIHDHADRIFDMRMYVFDNDWHYNQCYNWPIEAPIQIKHVHSSVLYQWPIYIKYDRRGHESPRGYGASKTIASYSRYPKNLSSSILLQLAEMYNDIWTTNKYNINFRKSYSLLDIAGQM